MDSSRIISCERSGFWSFEVSQKNAFRTATQISYPFSLFFAVGNPAIAARIVSIDAAILSILGSGTFSQVASPVIERIAVYMIPKFAGRAAQNQSVHVPAIQIWRSITFCIKRTCSVGPHGQPIPLRQPFKVSNINDRVLSLRKRDQTVGCIKRLSDFVSRNTSFHWSTFNGLNSAALYNGGL